MINIFIAILALAVGLFVGNIIFSKDEPKVSTETQLKTYHPIVRTFKCRNGLTKAKLVDEILKPCMVEFCHNWHGSTESFRWPGNFKQLTDRILEWYNPSSGYTELLLVASSDGNGSFQVDFTWKKPSHGAVDELGR